MLSLFFFELEVQFEDVKFLRATALPKDTDIEFIVMIQPGTGRFEITGKLMEYHKLNEIP